MTRARVLRDSHVVALALVVAGGAVWAHPLPTVVRIGAALATVLGLTFRRPFVLLAGAAFTASALAAASWAGLAPPPPTVVERQWATLVTDPAPFDGGTVGAELRLGARRVQAWARGPAASALAPRLAGERIRVTGVLRPLPAQTARRYAARHLSARLGLEAIEEVRAANPIGRAANAYRRLVTRGATSIPERLRPLFGGMVMGDDRGQAPELADAFRAAGLTHLLAVSGQNVAFVMLLAIPVLRRGGLGWRLAVTLVLLVAFGALTRWEPSVVRAEAMAAVAAFGSFSGRPVRGVRLLALAVTACLLIDPLLVHSVGFRLSAAACVGLVVLTPVLARRLPLLVAASIAAQAGAAIVLVPTFGSVPLVALPANVLAVPAAGPIMMWGLVAGPVAGLVAPLAPLLHLPTRLGLAWVAGVAEGAARLPLAPLGGGAAVLTGLGVLMTLAPARVLRAAGAVALAAVVLGAARGPRAIHGADLGGARLWVAGGRVVLVLDRGRAQTLLAALRARHVHRVDVLVTTRPGRAAADDAWPLVLALRPRLVLAPAHHQLAPARTVGQGAVVRAGTLLVEVGADGPPLEVHVTKAQASSPAHSASSLSSFSLRSSYCSLQCVAASELGYGPSWRSRAQPLPPGSTVL